MKVIVENIIAYGCFTGTVDNWSMGTVPMIQEALSFEYKDPQDYCYYVGRTAADGASMLVGAYVAAAGIIEIIGVIAGGALVTELSGGVAAPAAVSAVVAAVAPGVAITSYGVGVVTSGYSNFGDDWQYSMDASAGGAGKVYNAGGDAALRATRRPEFDDMVKNGVEVDGTTYKLNEHAYDSLFKSGRKDIMPDDIIDALATEPQPAQPGSVQYRNPSTGTTVFVNPNTNEIVGIWPSSFRK